MFGKEWEGGGSQAVAAFLTGRKSNMSRALVAKNGAVLLLIKHVSTLDRSETSLIQVDQ